MKHVLLVNMEPGVNLNANVKIMDNVILQLENVNVLLVGREMIAVFHAQMEHLDYSVRRIVAV